MAAPIDKLVDVLNEAGVRDLVDRNHQLLIEARDRRLSARSRFRSAITKIIRARK